MARSIDMSAGATAKADSPRAASAIRAPSVKMCHQDDHSHGTYQALSIPGCKDGMTGAFQASTFSQVEQSKRERKSLLSGVFLGLAGAAALAGLPILLEALGSGLRRVGLTRKSRGARTGGRFRRRPKV